MSVRGPSSRADDRSSEISVDPKRLSEWRASDHTLQVIDVRELYEREAGHIEGTRHIPLVELSAQADSVQRDAPVVFYCRVGARSLMAAEAFRASGFEAYSLDGGLARWAHEGRAISPKGGSVAEH